MGGKAIFIVANVIDKKAVEKAKTIVHNTFGKIDILINDAGENPLGTTDDERYDVNSQKDLKTFFDLDDNL